MEVRNAHQVPASQLASKYKSKKEIWHLLTADSSIYLCDYRCLTIYFLADIAAGRKRQYVHPFS